MGVLNDKFVIGLLGTVYQLMYHSHILFRVCMHNLLLSDCRRYKF